MAEEKATTSTITSAERILRIVMKMCDANLHVVVRQTSDSSVAIRGRAVACVTIGEPGIRISNISDTGMLHIAPAHDVRVEIRGMSTQVYFEAQIISRDRGSILVSMPTALVSLERRKNQRFATNQDQSAFIDLSILGERVHGVGGVNYADHLADLSTWLLVKDISEGGICAIARFPLALSRINSGMIDFHAKLILPMQNPYVVEAEVRWLKRVRERGSGTSQDQFSRQILIGMEFLLVNEELRAGIKQFARSINISEAI